MNEEELRTRTEANMKRYGIPKGMDEHATRSAYAAFEPKATRADLERIVGPPVGQRALIISRDDLRVGDWLLGWITSNGTPYTFPAPGRVADPTRAGHNRNDAPLIVVRGDEP